MPRFFDIDVDQLSGVAIVTTHEPLIPRCLSRSEIDSYVVDLKAELDEAAQRAKDAIISISDLPDFSEPH